MPIRCAAKAIIVRDGCILLNRCHHFNGSIYYDLPGGGQHTYELIEDALIREVREETGYTVRVVRFAGMAEEIYTSALMRERYPEYTHRILHFFAAEPTDDCVCPPSEKDLYMDECIWMPLDEAERQSINPEGIAVYLRRIVDQGEIVYLGSRIITDDE